MKIVNVTPLTDAELEFCDRKKHLLVSGANNEVDRRTFIRQAGLIGVGSALAPIAGALVNPAPAHANVAALIQAFFFGAIDLLKRTVVALEAITSTFVLWNSQVHEVAGPVKALMSNSTVGKLISDVNYLDMPAESKVEVEHSSFKAPEIEGETKFMVRSEWDQRSTTFKTRLVT